MIRAIRSYDAIQPIISAEPIEKYLLWNTGQDIQTHFYAPFFQLPDIRSNR